MHETLTGLAKVQKYRAGSEKNKKTWGGYVDKVREIVDGNETST